jgi:hypothetical protein
MIVGIKIGRRLTGVVGLTDEQFVFSDTRYAVRRREAQLLAFDTYIRHLLNQLQPVAIFYYAPSGPDTLADALRHRLTELSGQAGIPIRPLSRMDVFGSFGLIPPKTRSELRQVMSAIWPELTTSMVGRQDALAEAGAAALIGQLRHSWPQV